MHSAIFKEPVEGRVRVEGVNLAGDDQADRSVHGGPEKAVYAYAREDADWWEDVLGIDIPNAMFGENLTTEGLDVSGAYLRIVTEGVLAAGDEIEVISRPSHGVTIALVSDAILKDHSLIERVLSAPELAGELRREL